MTESVTESEPEKPKTTPPWLLLGTIVLAMAFFIWLPVEDTNPGTALVLATVICLLASAHAWVRSARDPCRRPWRRYPIWGLGLGAGAILLAVLMMLFKSGLHGHGFPDYLPEDFVMVVRWLPVYCVLGFSGGAFLGLIRWSRCRSAEGS